MKQTLNSIIVLATALFLVASLHSQDSTLRYPGGWVSHGDNCSISSEGILRVEGNGNDCTYFLSEPYDFKSGHSYMVTFEARVPENAHGTAITGPSRCNVDRANLTADWEEYSDVLTIQNGRTEAPLRMGQWHMFGIVEYRNIRVAEVFPIYANQGDISLGTGETLKTNLYTFASSFNSNGHMEARPLDGYTCDFNTDRLVFGNQQEAIYRFNVNGRHFLNGNVEANLHYYQGGTLAISVSADKTNWRELGRFNKVQCANLVVPNEFFPAETLYLRLRTESERQTDANNSDPGSLQVNSVKFKGTIDGAPIEMTGATEYAEIVRGDSNTRVSIVNLGEIIPSGDNYLTLSVKNISGQELSLAPSTTLIKDGQTLPVTYGNPSTLAPGATEIIPIPYNLSCTGALMLRARLGGTSTYEMQCKLQVSDYFNDSYGEILSNDAHATLWSAASEWKIPRKRPMPTKKGDALSIACAGGEYEAVQLVVSPNADLAGLNFQISDLRNSEGITMPASCIDILREHYLDIQIKTDGTSVLGLWPDPLPPVQPNMTLNAHQNQPFFIRAHIPTGTPAGIYRGTITLSAEDGWKQTLPLTIRVFGFDLPRDMTCQTAFGYNAWTPWEYQNAKTLEDKIAIHDTYLDFLSQHHISPYNPAPFSNIEVSLDKGETLEDTNVVINWEKWDKEMEHALNTYHFNTFTLPVQGLGSGTFHSRTQPNFLGYGEDTPEYKKLHSQYLKMLQEHLEKKGWLDKAFVYWFDEPEPKDYEFVMGGFRKLKEGAPRIRRMLTVSIEDALLGGPNLWCPPTRSVNVERWEARRALGEQCWWYVCTGPKAPYATLFIDHSGIEMRLWLWQTWQRRIQGVLIWHSNYWTSPTAYPEKRQNPYIDPMSWVTGYDTPSGAKIPWGNGDGRLYYPPEAAQDGTQPQTILDAPVTSFRLEMLRDGIEDYEYFAILERLLQKKGAQLNESDYAKYAALLEVPKEVTSEMTKFAVDSTPMKAHRIKLAEAIETLQKM